MDRLKKVRTPIRGSVTRTINHITNEFAKVLPDEPDRAALRVYGEKLQELRVQLQEIDQRILDAMLDANATDDEYAAESTAIEEHQDKMRVCRIQLESFLAPQPVNPRSPTSRSDFSTAHSDVDRRRRTYKLPKVEIRKFSGEVSEWLSWWNQFKRIDEDADLHEVDKFQYLAQAVVVKSKAEDVIKAYPQTADNYPKAIRALRERFGDAKVLKRVYVRELLKMIVKNSRGFGDITSTFDKLEAHLKALESLGITPEQMDVILFPMVESCLPEDILVAWQRSPLFGQQDLAADPPMTEFNYLLAFVKQEVKNQGQREMARHGFGLTKKEPAVHATSSRSVPTASSLLNNSDRTECIFCRKNHSSQNCFTLKRMTLEDKKNAVRSSNGCFRCLKKGHVARQCKATIHCSSCSGQHLHILCPSINQIDGRSGSVEASSSGVQGMTVSNNANHISCGLIILMKTLVVRVRGPQGRTREVRLLFDEGSQLSYLKKEVAKDLRCKRTQTVMLQNNLFGGNSTRTKTHNCYEVDVEALNRKERRMLQFVDEDIICNSCPSIPQGPWMQELYQSNIHLTDNTTGSPEVGILIGSDLWGKLMTGRMKTLRCGLVAVESIFGWTLSGEVPREVNTSCAVTIISMMNLAEMSIQEMWSLEALGIRDKAEQISREEHEYDVKEKFQNSISREPDGRYVVELPWVADSLHLPSNRVVAEKRLLKATEKLITEDLFRTYDTIFRSWEEEGIIEVNEDSLDVGHFLPHRPVIKPSSLTTPVRPVFDASSKTGKNPSLNQCLEKGPNMLELIPSILLRFREKRFGVTADIRKAFQMIGVKKEDRNYQKFLWWEDDTRKNLKIYEHSRVVFGLNCSPFILAAVLDLHLKNVSEERKQVADLLKKSLYVDNIGVSMDTEEELKDFQEKSQAIFQDAKMELRQWESNSRGFSSDAVEVSVLGLMWNKCEDTLRVQVPDIKVEDTITKRKVLSIVSQVYDPIGFTCPAVMLPKIMLQDSWAVSMDWDKPWDEEPSKKFAKWLEELEQLNKCAIPRWAFGGSPRGLTQLHLFCDASKSAYGAVLYARMEINNSISVKFLQAKSRLAPLDKKKSKSVTIPRLELMACLVGSRLLQSVQNALSLEVPCYLWNDSSTALAWIRRDEDWGTFVGNRSREINRLTSAADWRHVPGHLNPADLPSRGCSPSELVKSRWWEGPEWLRKSEAEWPKQESAADEEEIQGERKKTVVTAAAVCKALPPRFSTYLKNLAVAGWIRRFIHNIRNRVGQRVCTEHLSLQELKSAEKDVIKSVQDAHFPVTFSLKNLQVKRLDDGLLHVESRVGQQEFSELFRRPILLPKDDQLVYQMIEYVHKSNCHAGVQFVLGKIREKFWIISGRKTVSRVINKCVVCKRHGVKQMTCEPAQLPVNRTRIQTAFGTTGVDLAGPIILKGGRKAWIVIYTCALYRGVYLDVVNSISTDQFLESLEKFTWIIGRPNNVYSDNGTNFVGAHNLLKSIKYDKLQVKGINWIFNPPTAAWWGGWWERLIRTLKDLLRKMIGNARLNQKELERCLAAISYTMNNRPLTTLTEDPDDLQPLTPAMFMRDLPVTGLPEMEKITPKHLQESYQKMQALRKALQNRFRREYLSQLVQRGNESKKTTLKVGDVVLVGADNKKRFEWPLGRVMEVFPGKDGKVRVANVKTKSGSLIRPIQRLYPLEVSHSEDLASPAVADVQREKVHVELEEQSPPPDGIRTRKGRLVRQPVRYTSWNK